jgi:hypothetical protein
MSAVVEHVFHGTSAYLQAGALLMRVHQAKEKYFEGIEPKYLRERKVV